MNSETNSNEPALAADGRKDYLSRIDSLLSKIADVKSQIITPEQGLALAHVETLLQCLYFEVRPKIKKVNEKDALDIDALFKEAQKYWQLEAQFQTINFRKVVVWGADFVPKKNILNDIELRVRDHMERFNLFLPEEQKRKKLS